MTLYLKYGGAVLIMLAAILLGRRYSSYADRRIGECKGFLSLLAHINARISCFLTPPDGLLSDFCDDNLFRVGFLSAVKEEGSLKDAYSQIEHKLSLSKKERRYLAAYFSEFGKNYKDGELARIAFCSEALKRCLEEDECELPKNVKLTKTLLAAGALGIVILLI